MIYVANDRGSAEFLPMLHRAGCPAELRELKSGDFCFTGRGPKRGDEPEWLSIGIERKTMEELATFKPNRLSKQAVRMLDYFDRSYLLVEGHYWSDSQGVLRWFRNGQREIACPGTTPFHYSFVDNYLNSLAEFTGVRVKRVADSTTMVRTVAGLYKWWQKSYEEHASTLGYDASLLPAPKEDVPGFNKKVRLVTKMLEAIEGVGPLTAIELSDRFDTPKRMVEADVEEWLLAGVIGKKRAQSIREQLWGEEAR